MSADAAIDAAIQRTDKLRSILGKRKTRQVQSAAEQSSVRTTVLEWFKGQRPTVLHESTADALLTIDDVYRQLLEMAERKTARTVYVLRLRQLRTELVNMRSRVLMTAPSAIQDTPPNFATLIGDQAMQGILTRRWSETRACIGANAHLAATVMMGGLLEGLFLAKLNQMSSMAPAFKAKSAPKDKAGNPLQLKEWTLRDYIEVGHELAWITQSAKDVGVVLRDYRNFIHPQKEYSHGIVLSPDDTSLLWNVFKSITAQLLRV